MLMLNADCLLLIFVEQIEEWTGPPISPQYIARSIKLFLVACAFESLLQGPLPGVSWRGSRVVHIKKAIISFQFNSINKIHNDRIFDNLLYA